MKTLVVAILMTAGISVGAHPIAHDQFRFVGTVVSMDIPKSVLTFKTRENKKDLTLKVKVTDTTTVERDGKAVPRSDLKRGLNIVVDALGDDYDDMDGVKIRIVPPPARNP